MSPEQRKRESKGKVCEECGAKLPPQEDEAIADMEWEGSPLCADCAASEPERKRPVADPAKRK